MQQNWKLNAIFKKNHIICHSDDLNLILYDFSDEEWGQVSESQRKELGMTKEEDGEFWSVVVYCVSAFVLVAALSDFAIP